MIRKNKFRTWDEEEKRMCYGIDGDDDPYWRDGDCFGSVEMVNLELSNCYYIWEQSTGLLDKNGKEIYEGDIVRWVDVYDENAYINFGEGCFWVNWPIISERINVDMADDLEVIGNIHENPELLEKGE